MEHKLTTVIVNETDRDLFWKVGNRYSFVPLAQVKRGAHHTLKLCVDWAFQEFSLETEGLGCDPEQKLFFNSDELCDFERMSIKESDGQLRVEKVARKVAEPKVFASLWTWLWRFGHWLGWGTSRDS